MIVPLALTSPPANTLPPVKLAVPVVPRVNAPVVLKEAINVLATPPLKIFKPSAAPVLIRPLPVK